MQCQTTQRSIIFCPPYWWMSSNSVAQKHTQILLAFLIILRSGGLLAVAPTLAPNSHTPTASACIEHSDKKRRFHSKPSINCKDNHRVR